VLYWTKIETKDEIKTIALFHVLGLCLEIFKTHPSVGSWSYPEESFFKIGTVPLYSGFMYAAVGSYISQAWRIMKLNLAGPVPYLASTIIGIAIYLNFSRIILSTIFAVASFGGLSYLSQNMGRVHGYR
jgi:uncharacterized membrane protein YoaT (DUF817 family)